MERLEQQTITITTSGTDGSATGTGRFTAFAGFLLDVYLAPSGAQANTTDVTIAHVSPSLGDVLVVSNLATAGLYPVRTQAVNPSGAAITGVYDRPVVSGVLSVSIAQADDTESVAVTIRYLDVS